VVFETEGFPPIQVRGVFLDLQLNFSGGRLVRLGPPRLLSPFEAVSAFVQRDLAARALLPIGLSLLSERVVALALRAPQFAEAPARRRDRPQSEAGPNPPVGVTQVEFRGQFVASEQAPDPALYQPYRSPLSIERCLGETNDRYRCRERTRNPRLAWQSDNSC
jgi:hypothetical protein